MELSTILIAAFCGFWQVLSTTDYGYTLSDTLGQPVVVGGVVGLLMGDLAQGLVLGGSLELLYLGIIYPGGVVPACASSAALVSIPIALATGLDAGAATVLAVPFGLLGAALWTVKGAVFNVWTVRVNKCLEKKDFKGVRINATILPLLTSAVIFFVPVFLCNILGSELVLAVIDSIPEWAMHGIEVAGSLLPAIGFSIAVSLIGKKEIMPFFFIGYFIVQYAGFGAIAVAIFGACVAVLYYFLGNNPTSGASLSTGDEQ
ncbi:PTS mannose/fructose/sorbose/N-acetylgalactosamine transporter subunit IIC [Collinsella provencensis]|uniref:PTS mannose/fructose/sorbose/N-acetylgalactosamine transporter subunit IIC n=1 Tax=Collinsella provencensis TaxID=1937461 RepID=UPI000C817DD2|nr:PTS sugar transporter subunit IIC [Collinsella provencensis]